MKKVLLLVLLYLPIAGFAKQIIKVTIVQKGVEKCLGLEECIVLKLNAGWNIFSINNLPDSADLKYIFTPLINNNSIVKIQDKAGNSLENWGIFGGCQNSIDNISPSEGYKIKLVKTDSVTVCGGPVDFPYPIKLKEGWNIIGYPQSIDVSAMNVVSQLISQGTLVKVQDEAGNSLENWGVFGGWQNGIGHFTPGEGYKIKVNATDTLWIYEGYTKSTVNSPERPATIHFIPEYDGNGIDHMNINLVNLPLNILKAGDELAVFDGETCVGAVSLMPDHLQNQRVSIVASATDNLGMPGFIEGNPFVLKLWNSQQNTEQILEPDILSGPLIFTIGESTFASLDKYATTGIEDALASAPDEVKCYPNPFSNEVTIEINPTKDAQVQVEVLNQLGQRIKSIRTVQMFSGALNKISWDGRNADNKKVSQGIYFFKVNINGKNIYKKVLYQNN